MAECKAAIAAGADEVDVVISVGDVLERNYEKVYKELVAIREACAGVILKVILETGELKTIESVFNASLIGAYAGADFIKTSTGKVPVNATPETVYVICEALRQFHAQTGRWSGLRWPVVLPRFRAHSLLDNRETYFRRAMAYACLFQNRNFPITGRCSERDENGKING
ncbi:MAG: hypothetical protein ACLU4N_27275 [Butyricimonas faecihominis]